tara:strand:+ start:628 stop:1800 length:1173 start_codon:yes stop_codon:yes gene_type:complete
MSKKLFIGGGVIAVGVVSLLLLNNGEESSKFQMDETLNVKTVENKVDGKASLLVPPQPNPDSVEVKSVTINEGGFLAVRAVDGARLGQIVEISEYLAPGTHDNLSIALGEFYEGGEELMVMIYEDFGDDQIFNDLDQPYEEDGVPVAVYVATGDKVPQSITTNTGTPEGIPLMDMGTMEFIRYTDSGFEPKDVTISLGTMVHFVNESSVDMWVASDDHPAHTDLPTFDQFKGSGPGEQYVYIFDQVGEWKYHDHLNPTAVGTIVVTEAIDTDTKLLTAKNVSGYYDTDSDTFAKLVDDPEVTTVNVHIPYGGEIAGTEAFVPYNDTKALLAALPSDKTAPIALYCRSGGMSAVAAKAVVAAGYTNVYDLTGGMNAYRASGRDVLVKEQNN